MQAMAVACLRVSPQTTASLEEGPSLIPGDADKRVVSLHGLAGLKDIDHEPIYEQSEAALGAGPRNLDLHHSVLRAFEPWNTGVDERVELAGVDRKNLIF
jgi:hypothetical protein